MDVESTIASDISLNFKQTEYKKIYIFQKLCDLGPDCFNAVCFVNDIS